jgi:hypothetical protein
MSFHCPDLTGVKICEFIECVISKPVKDSQSSFITEVIRPVVIKFVLLTNWRVTQDDSIAVSLQLNCRPVYS